MAIILDGSTGVTTPSVNSTSNLISTVVSSPTSLSLKTNGTTTALTIDTSQNVGIGTASPGSGIRLDVLGGEIRAGRVDSSSEGGQVSFSRSTDNATAWYIDVYGNTSTPSLRIVDIGASAVALSLGSSGTLALRGAASSSGVGISFPGTQVASSDANTLDDYEEGTWTPTDNSGAGLSLTISGATYVKVGQIVTAYCQINYPSTANGNGASIAGLPFTVAGQDVYGGFTRYSTYGYVYPTLAQSGTYGSLYTTTGAQITNSSLSSKRVDFTYVYRSNA